MQFESDLMRTSERQDGESLKQNDLADLLVEHLERIGVKYIFGVPGGAIEPLYNAMARSARRRGLRPVVARHEAGPAFMADGYARETGHLGVCCSTTGPGATNLITGVASAYVDHIPLLVITAQTSLHLFGKQTLQESSCTAVNTVSMFQSCTRYSSLVSHRGQLEGKLISALSAAQGPPAGPAHLSIPMDVLSAQRRMRVPNKGEYLPNLLRAPELVDQYAVGELLKELFAAKQVTMLLGDGCKGAIEQILHLAEMLQAPIITSPSGKRWMDHRHPLYRGVLGYAGHSSARAALLDRRNDLILAIGSRLGDMVFSDWEEDEEVNQKLIHIDENPENFSRSPLARLHVCGQLRSIFNTLKANIHLFHRSNSRGPMRAVAPENRECRIGAPLTLADPDSCESDAVPIKPQRLMQELSQRLPENCRIFVDAGNSWAWATHYLRPPSSGLYRVAMGFGTMGWAIGASVGSSLASPGCPTVCITGDGSLLMNGQELTVAVAEGLPVIFIVLHDQVLGMVKHGQRLGGAEEVAFELPPVDFAQMARAMGAEAVTVKTPQELLALDFTELGSRPGPTLIDVHIDSEEAPPMGSRMKTLGRGVN